MSKTVCTGMRNYFLLLMELLTAIRNRAIKCAKYLHCSTMEQSLDRRLSTVDSGLTIACSTAALGNNNCHHTYGSAFSESFLFIKKPNWHF